MYTVANEWSTEENALIVAGYLTMLRHQSRGEKYNMSKHNRRLQRRLNGRSQQSIEFKHANISAVMLELGYPNIYGYKRRDNYQAALRAEIISAVSRDATLRMEAQLAVVRVRVFSFTQSPKLFVLSGSLRETCKLESELFRASPKYVKVDGLKVRWKEDSTSVKMILSVCVREV